MQKIVELKKKVVKTHETYPTFNDVEREEVKVWNRCATYFNVMRDISVDESLNYTRQFSVDDRNKMLQMLNMIKEKGLDNVKSSINRNEFVFLN